MRLVHVVWTLVSFPDDNCTGVEMGTGLLVHANFEQ